MTNLHGPSQIQAILDEFFYGLQILSHNLIGWNPPWYDSQKNMQKQKSEILGAHKVGNIKVKANYIESKR
jgi:hypothetical protein